MVICLRWLLIGALAFVYSISPPALAAQGPGAKVSAAPGALVRWAAPGTKRCSMKGRAWAALQETCYYPIDLLQKPALIAIARWGTGPRKLAHISVEPYEYGTEEIDLPNIPQANPSSEDLKRDSGDQALLSKVWSRSEGPPRFTLPLGAPANPLPKGKSFGVKRVFNGKPAPHLHTGADYTTPVGTPVVAVADGTVVAAKDVLRRQRCVHRPRRRPHQHVLPPLRDQGPVRAGGQKGPHARPGRIDGARHGTAPVLRRPLA